MICPHCNKEVKPTDPNIQLMQRKYHLGCLIEHLKNRKENQVASTEPAVKSLQR
jgi:hypothetical protein